MTNCTDGHRWMVSSVGGVILAICNALDNDGNATCEAELSGTEIDAILNEHATLKREKERLREFVNNLEEWVREFVKTEDALLADTQEGG